MDDAAARGLPGDKYLNGVLGKSTLLPDLVISIPMPRCAAQGGIPANRYGPGNLGRSTILPDVDIRIPMPTGPAPLPALPVQVLSGDEKRIEPRTPGSWLHQAVTAARRLVGMAASS